MDMEPPVESATKDQTGGPESEAVNFTTYDRRSLTYASTFDNGFQTLAIKTLEWMTGKISILRMIREFERRGSPEGLAFWRAALDVMGIPLETPQQQIDRIPETGPVVIVANHPHGLVDGMILADLIARRRPDFRILTRSLLTGIDEVASSFLIPVPFPHEEDAQRKSVEMRTAAMDFLKQGGVVSVFPSGVVATSETLFGPIVEAEWNVFTAQMIRRSGATVVPIHFPGANSLWYHLANQISPTLRQGLLLHEIVHSCKKSQKPVVGHPLSDAQMERLSSDPRGFIAWLRDHTISLKD